MILTLANICIPILFGAFVALDVVSFYPRIAGSLVKRNGIAYSFTGIVNTLKRVFSVLYPPFLGIIIIVGDIQDIFGVIALSYIAAAILASVSVFYKAEIIMYFCRVILEYEKGGSVYNSVVTSLSSAKNHWSYEGRLRASGRLPIVATKHIDFVTLFQATFIFFLYSSSIFTINIIAYVLIDYSQVILQLVGLFNAMGTIIMSFVLDPKLSRTFEKRKDTGKVLNSILLAHAVHILLISGLYFGSLYLYLGLG